MSIPGKNDGANWDTISSTAKLIGASATILGKSVLFLDKSMLFLDKSAQLFFCKNALFLLDLESKDPAFFPCMNNEHGSRVLKSSFKPLLPQVAHKYIIVKSCIILAL